MIKSLVALCGLTKHSNQIAHTLNMSGKDVGMTDLGAKDEKKETARKHVDEFKIEGNDVVEAVQLQAI